MGEGQCLDAPCCEEATPKGGRSKIRTTQIKQVDNGYIVEVGCKTFVVLGIDNLLRLFTQYINDPSKTEEIFNDGKLVFDNSSEL